MHEAAGCAALPGCFQPRTFQPLGTSSSLFLFSLPLPVLCSSSALTALLPSSFGVSSTPKGLRREHVLSESAAPTGPLEYCTFANRLRRWDRKMCKRNATTREAAPPLEGRRGQLADLRNRMGTEGLAWWPCAAESELPEPPDYGRRMRWSCFVDDSADGRGLLMMTLMMMMLMMMMMVMMAMVILLDVRRQELK